MMTAERRPAMTTTADTHAPRELLSRCPAPQELLRSSDPDQPLVRIAEVLTTIDILLDRQVVQAEQVAAVRARLDDLLADRRLREAMATLAADGRNAPERTARLRVALAADADYRAGLDAERQARQELARREAELWATRMKVRTCLALLRLAGDSGSADAEADGDGEEEAAP
jgi:hypothetical protein